MIARSERTPQILAAATRRTSNSDNHLGSYVGTKEDENSHAPFNGASTLGFVKKISDHMGDDQAAWNCSALIERVAERLSLPAFVKENAILLSKRILADRKKSAPEDRRPTVPTVSAYSLLSACRAAGVNHVSAKTIRQAHTDLGHRVTKAKLLRLGSESRVPLRPADPAALLQTVVSGLESNAAVAERLEEQGVEPRQYFRRLLQASQALVGELRGLRGTSPRTVATGAVYLASREIGLRVITQKDAAQTLGMAEYTVREYAGWVRHALGPAASGPLKGGTA